MLVYHIFDAAYTSDLVYDKFVIIQMMMDTYWKIEAQLVEGTVWPLARSLRVNLHGNCLGLQVIGRDRVSNLLHGLIS
jgi:hypothetical protein